MQHDLGELGRAVAKPGPPSVVDGTEQSMKGSVMPQQRGAASRVLLFHAVCFGWVFFRAEGFDRAVAVLSQLVQGVWQADLAPGMVLCVLAGIGLQYLPRRMHLRLHLGAIRLHPLVLGSLFALALTAVEVLGPSAPAPFIYFQF